MIQLPEDTKLDLRNAATLTDEELRAALEKRSCSGGSDQKAVDACFACTAANCTGTCYRIPCGLYINASQQVPPPAGFVSL